MSTAKGITLISGGSTIVTFMGSIIYGTATGKSSLIFNYFIIGLLIITIIGLVKWTLFEGAD